MSRIIDKINSRRSKHRFKSKIQNNDSIVNKSKNEEKDPIDIPAGWFYSFEFFPPKTEAGLDNLFTRIDRMVTNLDPLFIDVTWGHSGSTAPRTMAVASYAQRYCGIDVLLHLTCTGVTRELLANTLDQAKACGVRNILALRGDPPRGKRSWKKGDVSGGECDRAVDLVRLIRDLHGDYFGIAVAGHPEGHPSSYGLGEEISHLKEKMDAGADFILTQFFYDVNLFLEYVKLCRRAGIDSPIIPGIMPIQSFSSFMRMTEFCNISVPPKVLHRLEQFKHDDEAIKKIGCEIASEMCRTILLKTEEDGGVDGVHFYTLNLERSVTTILLSMGAFHIETPAHETQKNDAHESSHDDAGSHELSDSQKFVSQNFNNDKTTHFQSHRSQRLFPWRPSAMKARLNEDVRPINWANRPKSYVMRTEFWDEYPNGRWGDSTSPAFGELSHVAHFYSFTLGSDEDRRAMLGQSPTTPLDVYEVFAKYVEGSVPHIPWCETPLQSESFTIQSKLAALNRAGFLTINSQPPVNGAKSDHPIFGWGGPGGRVYQKAYCECFVSKLNMDRLINMVKENPSMNLFAVNNLLEELQVGIREGETARTMALTWGVFPNREIQQPTIFDPATFLVWAEEAFSLWTSMWLSLYDMDSKSYELIENIRDTYFLVAIIDNDFVADKDGGELWRSLLDLGNIEQ
eukprot:CAMPEP_0184860762 /NCGR_PEP_ID=MMETSP0580-20130426/5583_1 /TAXON_ID=1118495 /ORGANISM="Dactyliosolen fragilissimus" /LENGTH=683 /DNA_ID=CAMNT_0027357979 /DNA_START=17 /DNA_END=2065 /DNA_ORIENTATION=+